MEKSFLEYYDFYEGVCKERLYLQGQNMQVGCASLLFKLIGIYDINKHKLPVQQPVRYVWVTAIKSLCKIFKKSGSCRFMRLE